MKIDISEKKIIKAIETIRKLDGLDFPEVTDGNKLSDLFEVTSNLNDFSAELEEEIDY